MTKIDTKDISQFLLEGKTGPTKASVLVMRLVEEWEAKYRDTHKMDAGEWLRRTFGNGYGLRFFALRYKAAMRFSAVKAFDAKAWPRNALHELGAKMALFLDHFALIWLDGCLQQADEAKFLKALSAAYVANRSNPLTAMQVRTVYAKTIGKAPSRAKLCAGCIEKQRVIDELRQAKAMPPK